MLRIWNMVLVALAFELSVFGTFLTRSGVIESIHSFAKSSIGGWFLAFVIVSTLFSITLILWRLPLLQGAHEARVAALARGDVPLQQPAARRALPDDLLGRDLPDPDPALERDAADDRTAVLRLLPADLRAAAPAPDGHRAADRLAANLGQGAPEDAALADRRRARHRRRADRARRRLVAARADRLHVLRRSCSRRSSSSSSAARARPARWPSSSRGTGAATAATSSTRRSCCSRSGSSARAPTARPRSCRSRSASRCTSRATRSPTLSLKNTPKVTESGNSTETTGYLKVRGRWNGILPHRATSTPRRSASRTRSASTRTGSAARTST